jgi:hypothetical protein
MCPRKAATAASPGSGERDRRLSDQLGRQIGGKATAQKGYPNKTARRGIPSADEVRIREDRGMPRYVTWEPRPRRVGAKKGHENSKGIEHRAEGKNVSTTAPGADKRLSPATLRSKAGGTR